MPNWKKVIVSGSAANLSNLVVSQSITASAFSGDGSALTGINASIVSSSTVADTFTSATTHSVSHTLGTKDLIVNVYDNSDDVFVPARINTPDTSTVVLYMDPATTGRVVIGKSGHIVSGSTSFSSITGLPSLISGSAQLAANISGSITAISSSVSNRISLLNVSASAINGITSTAVVPPASVTGSIDFDPIATTNDTAAGTVRLTGFGTNGEYGYLATFLSSSGVAAGTDIFIAGTGNSGGVGTFRFHSIVFGSNLNRIDFDAYRNDGQPTTTGDVFASNANNAILATAAFQNEVTANSSQSVHYNSSVVPATLTLGSNTTVSGSLTVGTTNITAANISGSFNSVSSSIATELNNATGSVSLNTRDSSTFAFWQGSQAQYDALGSYDSNVIYFTT